MNANLKLLRPYLETYGKPEAEALTNHKDELWFFLDYEKALLCGERVIVGKEPIRLVNGRVLVSASAVEHYLCKAFAAEVVDSRRFISVETAVEAGLHVFYNYDIGVLVFGKEPMAYKNEDKDSLRHQILRLGDLIFYDPTAEQLKKDILKTRGTLGKHPILVPHTDGYAPLKNAYQNENPKTEKDQKIRKWVLGMMVSVDERFDRFFELNEKGEVVFKEGERKKLRHPYYLYDENGARLVFVRERTYKNADGEIVTEKVDGSPWGDGYDRGGRYGSDSALHMASLSLGYIITGEKKYLDATYQMGLCAGELEHWGDGHFLNCAEAASNFALAFDRIYNGLSAEQREIFADILYEKGLKCGISASLENPKNDTNVSYLLRGAWTFVTRGNNWISVCAGGMFRASCMLMGFDRYADASFAMMEKMISILRRCLSHYAPDGAYIESVSYWLMASMSFVNIIEDMISVCGTDYGYLDTVGFEDSFLFASRICDPRRAFWNFHDSSGGRLDTHLFAFAARYFDDPTYAAVRKSFFEEMNGGLRDIFYYDDIMRSIEGDVFSLDYCSHGIETATFRSTWEREGFHFAGLHGGASEATHGCSDAGNFYLEMDGELWFGDPGKESYSVPGYWGWKPEGAPRYRYYRKSVESHNLVFLLDEEVPYGHVFTTHAVPYARIIDYKTSPDAGYAVLDMTPQYGAPCKSAKRALALTENRTAVVLRDEIEFSRETTALWVATPEAKEITFSEDGRVAYMTKSFEDGTRKILRASILSGDKSLRFEIVPEKETFLPSTITKENSGNTLVSDAPVRLLIKGENVKTFNLSVVFEIVKDKEEKTKIKEMKICDWN